MAAAPPHSWPSASAAILFSMEMAPAGPGFPPPPFHPPPPCSPSFPSSPAPRPSASRPPLETVAAQPPFFLKGGWRKRREAGAGRDFVSDGDPTNWCPDRRTGPSGSAPRGSVDWLGREGAVPAGRGSPGGAGAEAAARREAGAVGAGPGAGRVGARPGLRVWGSPGRGEGPSGFSCPGTRPE